MKNLIITTLLCLLTLSSVQAAHPQCGETELSSIMGEMQDSMKAIKKATKAKDSAAVTKEAEALLVKVKDSYAHIPLTISDNKDLTEKQKEQYSDYKKGLKKLEKAVTELVEAKDAKAQKEALGKIGKSAKSGHKAYKMDCDD